MGQYLDGDALLLTLRQWPAAAPPAYPETLTRRLACWFHPAGRYPTESALAEPAPVERWVPHFLHPSCKQFRCCTLLSVPTHANTHTQCDTAPSGLQDLIATLTAELEVLQGVNARLLLSLGRVVSTWRSVVTENCRLKAEIAMHGPMR